MKVERLLSVIDADFYTGVPDSRLRALCDHLMARYHSGNINHVIAANEGNAAGIAAGYHLATGKVPVVYLQNSGEGNLINPLASLLNENVYAIPCVFLIGWRGEPGIPDEPQHLFQGEVTCKLLEDMSVPYFLIKKETTDAEAETAMKDFRRHLSAGKQVAFVICEGGLVCDQKPVYQNDNSLRREDALREIVSVSGDDPIVCTTGKASRELFEIREMLKQGHDKDFLTVGSMGHASSVALGIALQKPRTRVWCIDGDGALLMHMGALPVIADLKPNLIHVVINNGAHESVGGMPTAAMGRPLYRIAAACGYGYADVVYDINDLQEKLKEIRRIYGLAFLEVKCTISSRKNLGRPTTSPVGNKNAFMKLLKESKYEA